jgi:phosphonate transport system substrate-binding protein
VSVRSPTDTLRLASYLSPGLPASLFEDVADVIGRELRRGIDVEFFTDSSGPLPGRWPDGIDLAFVCAPAFVDLRRAGLAELVPAAMVFSDSRNGGRPRYHSDVVVACDSPFHSLSDLANARWAVNDPQSLSGYRCVLDGTGPEAELHWSGGHLQSAELIRRGLVDAAAIDANVLAAHSITDLKIVHTFGPHPVQPLIAQSDSRLAEPVAEALLRLRPDDPLLRGFAPASDADYPDWLA